MILKVINPMWKDKSVDIFVYRSTDEEMDNYIAFIGRFLDTDTMSDVFDTYSPDKHIFEIRPSIGQESADY